MRWNVRRVLAAAALVFAAGIVVLHGARDRARGAGEWSRDTAVDPSADSRVKSVDDAIVRHAVWSTQDPAWLAAEVTAGVTRASPSPDGRFLVFARGERCAGTDLWIVERVEGERADGAAGSRTWGEPRVLDELTTAADETAPYFTRDALYFASDRAGGAGGLDLYRASFDGLAFGAAERLPDAFQSARDDTDPCVGDGRLLFASDRGGQFDLFEGPLHPTEPRDVRRVDELGSLRDEREPAFDADLRAVYFASDRAGDFDLFRAVRRADDSVGVRFDEPLRVSEIATRQPERGPFFTSRGGELGFTRVGAEAGAEIVLARSVELVPVPRTPWSWVEIVTIAALVGLALLTLLAERWPKLETLYWCYLISLIVHLLLLWWFHAVYLDGGEAGLRDEGRPIRVRVSLDASELAARRVERAGRVSVPEPATARAAAPARARLEALEQGPERPSTALEVVPQSSVFDAPTSMQRPELAVAVPRGSESGPSTAGLVDREARRRSEPGTARDDVFVASAVNPTADTNVAAPSAPRAPERASIRPEGPDSTRRPAALADPTVALEHLPAPEVARSSGMTALDTGVARAAREVEAPPLLDRETRARPDARSGSGDREALAALEPASIDTQALSRAPSTAPSRAPGSPEATLESVPLAPRVEALASAELAGPPAPSRSPDALRAPAPARHEPLGEALADREAPVRRLREGAADSQRDRTELEGATALDPRAFAALTDGIGARAAASPSPTRLDLAARDALERAEPTPRAPPPVVELAAVERPPVPAPDTRTPWSGTPYQNRTGEARERALRDHGGDEATEAAVERGLAYLARIQAPSGAWGDLRARDAKYGRVAIGKSALATLAFLGAGHTHRSNTRHSAVVALALAFLLDAVDERTGHIGDTDAYGHGIATYALAEAYALTRDAELRPALELAVARIVAAQSRSKDERRAGGWSYFYPDGREFDRWSRTSITSWMVMALESARLSGVEVPEATFTAAARFLEGGWDEELQAWRYNHDPERLDSGYPTLPASTPGALFALSITGTDVGHERFAGARRFLLERVPKSFRFTTEQAFVRTGQGNPYFVYQGTLASFRIGGGAWESWNEGLKRALLPAQRADGAWAPIDVYARYAGDGPEDAAYTTAMCVLSLEVYYRYYLPLLKTR